MDHTVADCIDLAHGIDHAVFCAGELFDNGGNGFGMSGQGNIFVVNRLISYQRTVLQVTVNANAFAETLGHDLFGLHIDQLVLQRGAACVDNENFHEFGSFLL